MTEGARIAVVIPTHNGADRIGALLAALDAQVDAGPFEVVVVDDGSTDGTSEVVARLTPSVSFPCRVLRHGDAEGPAAARNRGWRASPAELVAFTDDDCLPAPRWLAALRSGLAHQPIAVGRTRPPPDQLAAIGPFSEYLDIGHNGTYSTCNIAYRREVLEATGGFDADLFRAANMNGEDTELGLRAAKRGYGVAYVEDALVWHDVHPSSFRSHLRRIRRMEGLVTLVAVHPEARQQIGATAFLRSIDKAVLLVWGATALVAARPRWPLSRAALAAAAALYLWQFPKARYRPRSVREWVSSVPLGLVADSWIVVVMLRGSLRWRTVLL